jgi:hypothetical protein
MITDIEKTVIATQFLTGLRTRDWNLLKSIDMLNAFFVPK